MEKEYNTPQEEASYYKEAYEQEKARSASLAGRLADARNEADTLQFQLDRIKNNPMWKASKPLRQTMHWGLRNYRRLRNLGGPKGIARKLRQKKREQEARKLHGTASFPTPEEAARQRDTKFDRMVNHNNTIAFEPAPQREYDMAARSAAALKPAKSYTGDKGIKLGDVFDGRWF